MNLLTKQLALITFGGLIIALAILATVNTARLAYAKLKNKK